MSGLKYAICTAKNAHKHTNGPAYGSEVFWFFDLDDEDTKIKGSAFYDSTNKLGYTIDQANKNYISRKLGTSEIIEVLDRTNKSLENKKSKSSFIEEKLEAVKDMYDDVHRFILESIHKMYWYDDNGKKPEDLSSDKLTLSNMDV